MSHHFCVLCALILNIPCRGDFVHVQNCMCKVVWLGATYIFWKEILFYMWDLFTTKPLNSWLLNGCIRDKSNVNATTSHDWRTVSNCMLSYFNDIHVRFSQLAFNESCQCYCGVKCTLRIAIFTNICISLRLNNS